MRVLLDTNILVSAIFFPSERTRSFLEVLTRDHDILLAEYSLEELRLVVSRKFPSKLEALELFFDELPFTLLPVVRPGQMGGLPAIRDIKDLPILASAILEHADVLVTGDKDFLVLNLDYPQIMTMSEFVERFAEM